MPQRQWGNVQQHAMSSMGLGGQIETSLEVQASRPTGMENILQLDRHLADQQTVIQQRRRRRRQRTRERLENLIYRSNQGHRPAVPMMFDAGTTCAICMDAVDDGESVATVNPCEHQFHQECLDMWISTLLERRESGISGEGHPEGDDDDLLRGTCPLCRVGIHDITVEVQGQAISTPPPERAREPEAPNTPDSFAPAMDGQPTGPIDQFPVWVSFQRTRAKPGPSGH